MKLLTVIPIALLITGCDYPERSWGPDQCLRQELFKQCLAALPAGPVSTEYNDWDEVVSKCETSSYYQSLRSTEYIKLECRIQ